MTKTGSVVVSLAVVLVLAGAFAYWNEGAAKKSSCPAGAQKFVHMCIEKTDRQPEPFVQASEACAADQRRLPTSAELDAFRQQPGITLASPDEWTSDFTSAASALGISDAGNYVDNALPNSLPFRCVA
jgi:hypothetical protein